MSEKEESWRVALLVLVGTARSMLNLGQCLRIECSVAKAQSGREGEPDCEYWSDAPLSINCDCRQRGISVSPE